MEYVKIKNEKIIGHFSAAKLPKGKEYKKVTAFNGYVGIAVGMLNENGSLKTIEELTNQGFVKDNRGDYWNTSTKRKITIRNFDVEIPEGFTKHKPNQFDDWDGGKWVENIQKKQEYENKKKISEAEDYLYSTDWYILREFDSGKPTPTDIKRERQEKRDFISSLK